MNRLVVIGNGMAGVACVEQILKHAPKFDITIFGEETHVNYNRILLSSVLAGEKVADDIVLNSLDWYEKHRIQLRLGVRITEIDPASKTVTGDDGSVTFRQASPGHGKRSIDSADGGHEKGRRFCFSQSR